MAILIICFQIQNEHEQLYQTHYFHLDSWFFVFLKAETD